MKETVKISANEYRYLIATQERINVLKREMEARAKIGNDLIGFDALKTLFDLWDEIPEVTENEREKETGNGSGLDHPVD